MRHLAAALALLCAFAAPAFAGDEPIGDGRFARIRLGWDGFFPGYTVAPVTLLLANPDPREHVLRIVVSPADGGSVETTVTLPPGARKRVRFALRARRELTVSLSDDGRVVALSHHLISTLPPRAVLVVDGEPETLVAQDLVTGPIAFSTPPEDLPEEIACLAPFAAVILRMLDPSVLDAGARRGLDDFVRAGGTVVIMGTLERAATRAYYEDMKVSEERTGASAFKRRGLGRVVLEPMDLGAPEDAGKAIDRRAALGRLLEDAPPVLFPRIHVGRHPRDTAIEAGLILAGFLAAYVLVAGPVFMVALRRARPVRVLQATVLLLLAFMGLGALTANRLLRAKASIKAFTFIVFPRRSEAVALTDVLIQSGGGRSLDLSIEGNDASATSFARRGGREWDRWGSHTFEIDASRTLRGLGHRVIPFVGHPLPPFGETSLSVLSSPGKQRPIVARVDKGPGGAPQVTIENDSGHALGATLVFERFARDGLFSLARFAGVPAGAKLTAPLSTSQFLDPGMIGIPRKIALLGWCNTGDASSDLDPARFQLIAEEEPVVSVHAARATIEEHTWRVQDVDAPPLTAPGFLGITVQATPRGAKVTSVAPDSPAESVGWSLQVGRIVTSMAGIPVRSQEDVDHALRWAGPGATIQIACSDGDVCEVMLGASPAVPSPGTEGN